MIHALWQTRRQPTEPLILALDLRNESITSAPDFWLPDASARNASARIASDVNDRARVFGNLNGGWRVQQLIWGVMVLCLSSLQASAQTDDSTIVRRSQPRWELLVRHTDQGPQAITSPDAWLTRRDQILWAMQQVMGEFPKSEMRVALEPVVESVELLDHVARIHLTYVSQPGSRVPAFLFVPLSQVASLPFEVPLTEAQTERLAHTPIDEDSDLMPGMLCLHPTEDVLGNRVVTGIAERPTMGYALELAERGYVTLAPAYPLLADYQPDLAALGWKSGSMKAIWDNSRAIDLLQSLSFVDGERLGAIGHSLGGHNAVYSAVIEQRIKLVVSSCGLDAYVDYYDGNEAVWEFGRGWCQHRYIPDLAKYRGRLEEIPYDFPELIAAIAPRPVLISAPIGDDNFRWRSVDRIQQSALPVYRLLEAEGQLVVTHPEGPHDFSDAARQMAYEWIDRQLKP